MTDVYCPACGAILPFSVFAKQVAKRKHSRSLILQIIAEHDKITTGQLAMTYQSRSGEVISLRHLGNILGELERQGKIETRLIDGGRYGRTKLILRGPAK